MRRGVGQFNQAYGRGNCSRREDQRCGSYNDRGGRGRSFRPDSSSSSRYDSPHQQQHGSYGHYGSGASRSFSALDADSVADRQRDRKARRRQERQEKKQLRIERHEQWTQKSQKARQEARNSRAADQIHQQRKRLRAERALTSTAAERNSKRHKGEQALKEKSEKCVRATASDCMEGGPATSLKADTCKPSTGVLAAAAAATAVSPATSLAEMTPVPAEVTETVRRLVNKLTTANVVDLTRELSDYMLSPGVSPVSVVKGLAQQIERLCLLEAGPLSTTGTLPFAGLLRGMQLLHGIQLGSELVERISFSLKAQLAAAEEAAAGNTLMVLAQLYLLYGVDVVFVTSLLRTLLRQGTRLLGRGDDGGATTSMDSSSSSPTSASAAAAQAVCAAACGLALMRACGEKLLKESPAELEASLQEARRASAQMRNITGMARFSALVEVMGDIAAGRTRKARRTTTEEAAPAEAMLEDLCLLLPGQERAISTQRRTMKRLVLTTNIMSGLTWEQVTSSAKPPRWYIPGVMMTGAASDREEDDKAAAATAGKRSCIVPESKEGRHSREISALQPSLWTAADESEQVEEMDEAELKRERIARMRTEEKALSGQRLNTEHKREIFRCIATATDDLECFTMLMYRDPGYTRFHDACAVLLQCAYQERKYNPYYAQVLMRFCSAKPACVKTLQFAIWDRFKSIRIESTDVVGYFNFACCIADLMQHGVYNLSLLRGLDLENTNKTIGLFARMLLLRLIFQLPALRLTQLFFGGDGCTAHDLQVDTSALRRLLTKFMSLYFIDENASKRWLPSFYEVVAAGTSFDVSAAPEPQTAPASRNGAAPTADADKRAAKVLALQLNTGCSPSTLLTNASAPFRTALSASKSASSAEAMFDEFMKRVQVAYRALKQGIV